MTLIGMVCVAAAGVTGRAAVEALGTFDAAAARRRAARGPGAGGHKATWGGKAPTRHGHLLWAEPVIVTWIPGRCSEFEHDDG
jgi:hypothetical protein